MMQLYETIASFNLDLRPELAPTILAPEILLPSERLQEITCPVITVTGRHDSLVPPEVMHHFASLIPGAKCIEFEQSGHSPYFEEPSAFNAVVERAVSEVG